MKLSRNVAVIFIAASLLFIACDRSDTGTPLSKGDGKISWKNFEQAAEIAAHDNKKLFVYVHTDWCSWCRKMENETFSDDAVAEYLNNNYIPVSIDAESQQRILFNGQRMTEEEVASALGVEGYPTNIFLSSDGDPITVAPGYLPPDRFMKVLSYIAEDYYTHMEWDEYANRSAVD